LVALLPQHVCVRADLWLVRPSHRANLPRVAALADFLSGIVTGSASGITA